MKSSIPFLILTLVTLGNTKFLFQSNSKALASKSTAKIVLEFKENGPIKLYDYLVKERFIKYDFTFKNISYYVKSSTYGIFSERTLTFSGDLRNELIHDIEKRVKDKNKDAFQRNQAINFNYKRDYLGGMKPVTSTITFKTPNYSQTHSDWINGWNASWKGIKMGVGWLTVEVEYL